MKIHAVIVEFALHYGIKEALLLSELCHKAYTSGAMAVPFSVSQGVIRFPYMSAKQIRLSLSNLIAKEAIKVISQGRQSFDRSCTYKIDDQAYHEFLENIHVPLFLFWDSSNAPRKE